MSRLSDYASVTVVVAVGLVGIGCDPAVFGGCVEFNTFAEASGIAFPKSRPDEKVEVMYLHTVTRAEGVNELFASFEASEVDLMEFCLSPGQIQQQGQVNFRLNARLELGVPQSPRQFRQTPRCFQDFTDDGSGMGSFFGGSLDAPTGRVEFTTLEAAFIDRSPPTLDVRFEGADPEGTIWVFELRVVTGTAGNAMNCT